MPWKYLFLPSLILGPNSICCHLIHTLIISRTVAVAYLFRETPSKVRNPLFVTSRFSSDIRRGKSGEYPINYTASRSAKKELWCAVFCFFSFSLSPCVPGYVSLVWKDERSMIKMAICWLWSQSGAPPHGKRFSEFGGLSCKTRIPPINYFDSGRIFSQRNIRIPAAFVLFHARLFFWFDGNEWPHINRTCQGDLLWRRACAQGLVCLLEQRAVHLARF